MRDFDRCMAAAWYNYFASPTGTGGANILPGMGIKHP
jgi:hypothetical protein